MRSIEPTEVPPYFWTINTGGPYHAACYGSGVNPFDVRVVLSTFPDEAKAAAVAHALVNEHLVACVNLVPAVRSIYRWQGAVSDEREVLAIMKTTADAVPALTQRILQLHPYETPEVIAVPVTDGNAAYLAWVAGSIG